MTHLKNLKISSGYVKTFDIITLNINTQNLANQRTNK